MSKAQALPPKFDEFDPETLRLSGGKVPDGKTVYISTNNGDQAIFYIPKCRLAHGVGCYQIKEGAEPSPKLSYSMTIDVNEDFAYFGESWPKIEQKLKELCAKDSKVLFKKPFSLDDISKKWEPKLKEGQIKDDGTKYNDGITIKQQFDWESGKSKTQYLDAQDGNKALEINYLNAMDEIPRGSVCNMYLRLYKISFISNKFHVGFYPTMVSINRPEKRGEFAAIPIASDEVVGTDHHEEAEASTSGATEEPSFEVEEEEVEEPKAKAKGRKKKTDN